MDRWAKAGYGSRGDLRGLPCWTVFIRNGEGITQSRPMRLAPLMRPAPASWRMRAGVTSSAMAACAAVTSFTACHAGVRLRSGLAGTLCGICSGRTALGYARCSCRWPSAAQGWRKALSLSGTWSNLLCSVCPGYRLGSRPPEICTVSGGRNHHTASGHVLRYLS